MPRIWLSSPAPIAQLVDLGLANPASGYDKESDGEPADVGAAVCRLLAEKAEMLAEYLGLEIENDAILSLPQLVDAYVPPLNGLPLFVLRLASHVDWTAEEPCFESLAKELARLYRVARLGPEEEEAPPDESSPSEEACSTAWTMQHVLLPAIRKTYEPPTTQSTDSTVVQIASTETLYRVFERC